MKLGMCLTPVGWYPGVEDYPRNLREFDTRFSSEEGCREYLFKLRWRDGFCCPPGAAATSHGQVAALCAYARVADTSRRSRRGPSFRTRAHHCGYGRSEEDTSELQ